MVDRRGVMWDKQNMAIKTTFATQQRFYMDFMTEYGKRSQKHRDKNERYKAVGV